MTTKDLMLGNWLMSTIPGYKGEFFKVEAIEDGIVFHSEGYTNGFEPIPLDEDILHKNFFDDELTFAFKNVKYNIRVTRLDNDSFLVEISHRLELVVRYVHELQNALHICGIDLDISL